VADKWALLADVHLLDTSIIPKLPTNLRKDRSEKSTLARERLTQVVDEVASLASRPASLILNGDCVEVGTPAEYGLLLDRFDNLLQAEISVHFTLGNHDHRANFSGSRLPHASLAEDRYVSVVETEHANWVLLDSLVM
jgi:3',5'-cyclic AMP phosphodiesterase CpdA